MRGEGVREEREVGERRGGNIIKVFVASECVGLPLCNLRYKLDWCHYYCSRLKVF